MYAIRVFVIGFFVGAHVCSDVGLFRECGYNEEPAFNRPERYCGASSSSSSSSACPLCVCRSGYARNSIGECVPISKCNQCQAQDRYSEYRSCGTACPLVCGERVPDACILLCVADCFCLPGYIRSARNGPCVPIETCPPLCGLYAHYTTCASNCPEVCNEPPKFCHAACLRDGCDCDEGYILSPDRTRCISEEECDELFDQ